MRKKLMLSLLTVVSFLICNEAFADMDCMTVGEQTVCGYDCKIVAGQAACAKTEYGTCIVAGGRVQCWDPPAWIHKKASCMVVGDEAVCGFECRIAAGKGTCSTTPYGVCSSVDGRVYCWDPPRGVRKKAECIISYGKSACGYDCKIAGGNLKCANTPNGKCVIKNGDVICSDDD